MTAPHRDAFEEWRYAIIPPDPIDPEGSGGFLDRDILIWNAAMEAAAKHIAAERAVWDKTDISPEHLLKHLSHNVLALKHEPPKEA